jgi:hypothetical protein
MRSQQRPSTDFLESETDTLMLKECVVTRNALNCQTKTTQEFRRYQLCYFVLNLLNQEQSLTLGIKNKRLIAGWDHGYLLAILQPVFPPG